MGRNSIVGLFFIFGLLTTAASLAAATVAAADGGSYTCTGNVGDESMFGNPIASTLDANVDVPAGAFCSMVLVTVTGNVTVEGTLGGLGNTFEKNVLVNGGLIYFPICVSLICGPLPANHVEGNVVVNDSPGGISLSQARFDKNVIVNGVQGDVQMIFASTGGNVILSNVTGLAGVQAGDVDGNLILIGNGGGYVIDVEIGGNLECEANATPLNIFNASAARLLGQCGGV